jgi:hypothetical protein
MQFETFAPLRDLPFIAHAFTLRTAEDTKADDYEAGVVQALGFTNYARAEQPHGNGVAVVEGPTINHPPSSILYVDALVTRERNLPLVIRCTDCAPVFIVDRRTPAIALVHSGKQGTRANVAGNTVRAMLGNPEDCLAFIGPSIGPCHYEMDIWSGIEQQLRDASIGEIHNPRVCTACHLDRYFSYRAEKGRTGRMFAVLWLR